MLNSGMVKPISMCRSCVYAEKSSVSDPALLKSSPSSCSSALLAPIVPLNTAPSSNTKVSSPLPPISVSMLLTRLTKFSPSVTDIVPSVWMVKLRSEDTPEKSSVSVPSPSR